MPPAWDALTSLLGETWPHQTGARLAIARLGIDTGCEAPAVYAWTRRRAEPRWSPVKGVERLQPSAPVSGPTYVDATEGGVKIRRGARLWTVAVATFKSETYRFLRLERPTDEEIAVGIACPAGFVHLPRGVDAEWVKQLVAEQLVTVKTRRGFTRLEWQKLRERNEALDCRVYARAAAWIAGADRWGERRWRELEAQLGIGSDKTSYPLRARDADTREADETSPPAIAGQIAPRPRRGRRVFRSSYVS